MGAAAAPALYLLAEERRGAFDGYRADHAVATIRAELARRGSVATHVYHAADADPGALADAIETPSLFGGRTLVVLRGAEALPERAQERLVEALERQAPQVTLVVVARGGDMRRRFFARCRELGRRLPVDHPRPSEMRTWVDEFAAARKRTVAPDAAERLLDCIGCDLLVLASELDKLAAAVPEGRRIEASDVTRVTAAGREHANFEVADALCARDAAAATRRLAQSLDEGAQPIALVGAFAATLRPILAGAELVARGRSAEQAARELAVPPFQRRTFQRGLQAYRPGELRQGLARLAAIDLKSKTGAGDARALLEDWVLRLCAGSGARGAGRSRPPATRGR